MLKLRFINNPHSAIWLVEPKVILGASATSDLVLSEAGIDAQQAEIQVNYEDLLFKQLSDAVVTRINNNPVAAGQTVPLNVGDKLQIGQAHLEVIDPKRQQKHQPSPEPIKPVASGWVLKANHTALSNRVYPLNGDVVIGRSSECDIALAAAHLSRRHAQISLRDGGVYVKDLGSSNGPYLNGKRIDEARIKRGDELRFDTLSFGVIGPADELDKTTLRTPAVGAVAAAASVQKPQTTSAKNSVSARGSKSAEPVKATTKATAPRAHQPIEVNASTPKPRGAGAALVIALLVIVVAGAVFAWQNR